MSHDKSQRDQMRNDLRELAKLAKPDAAPPSHGFQSADSSGFVDLSAFSVSDPAWVDRELARARAGAPPALPGRAGSATAGGRAIDRLSPESMAPVSLESFLVADETSSSRRSRGRKALYGVLAVASIAGVGALAFVVNHNAPAPLAAAGQSPAVAAPAAAPTDTAGSPQATSPADPAQATPAAPSPAAPAANAPAAQAAAAPAEKPAPASKASAATTPASKRVAGAARAHSVAAAPGAAPAAAPKAVKPVVIPAAVSKPSGDSLMDAIRSSVAKGK
jgi:hypothetical protein